jgi:polysaccharide biosynthesis/export protein
MSRLRLCIAVSGGFVEGRAERRFDMLAVRSLLGGILVWCMTVCGPVHAQQGFFPPPTTQTAPTGMPGSGMPTQPAPFSQTTPLPTVSVPSITNPVPSASPTLRPSKPAAVPAMPAGSNSPEEQALEKNEFQNFLAASTGQLLPLYGHNLFRDVPSTFAPVENIPVTPDYVIGPGDELYIRAWGQIDVDYRSIVDRNGTISIPRIGVINVAGIRYQDLSGYLKSAVSRVFRNFELAVNMGQLRSIQVFVVGHARRPGSYTVSSLSTLVNAVFAAGGPSPRGSMRNIRLNRANKTVTDLDLYDLLVYGDKSKDVQLLPGDVIYFPPIGALAGVAGSVNTPAIFELKGDTSLDKLIEWSGGLATTAQTRTATIERIDDRRVRIVDKFSLEPSTLRRPVRDGDLLTILPVAPRFQNAVTLRGNVAVPLRHPFVPGMRISDLVPEKDALITYDYYRRQNRAVQDAFLSERIRSGSDAASSSLESTERAVRRTSPENLFAEINWDYAVIERLDENDFTTSLIPFNLGKAILEADPTHNVALRAGDIVTIFSKADINVPVARQTKVVRLEGEFNFSGVYQVQPGETLRQLIVRVGGLAGNAYVFGTELRRESVRLQQQKSYQDALNRLERELQASTAERARSVLSPEDAQVASVTLASQQSAIAKLRDLKPTGRIALQLPHNAAFADLPDIPLEDGDRVFVPAAPVMVSVFGAVFTEGAFLYRDGSTAGDYISLAGGTTKRADNSQIFVLRADGSATGGGSGFLSSRASMRIMPGDTVVVPDDDDRQTWTKSLKDWTQIFYQFGLGAAALKVLRD